MRLSPCACQVVGTDWLGPAVGVKYLPADTAAVETAGTNWVIAAVSAYGLHSFIPNPWAEVYWLRASLVSCEAVLVSLPWFFHRDLLFLVKISGLPEKRILSEVQHRRSEVLFPLVWLSCRDLLSFRCSEILFPLVCLLCSALLAPESSRQRLRVPAVVQ